MNNQEKTINEENPLPGFSKQNLFSVPENYFEKLPIDITDRISSHAASEKKWLFAFPKLAILTAIVLAVSLTGSLYFINLKKTDIPQTIITYEDLQSLEIADEFEDYMLIEHFLSLQTENPSENVSTNSQNKMNDYLIENNIDINLIISEL